MKKVLLNAIAMLSVPLMLAGCDWTTGGGVDTYNDSYNWVNFSGVYSGPKGYLVSQYTANPPTGTNVATQGLGTGSGGRRSFSGGLGHTPVAAGSLIITAGGYVLSDNGSGTLIGSVDGASGTIAYSSGGWSITLPAPIDGQPITATYIYTTANPSSNPGSTGVRIYAFTVWQEGNVLQITDNNGSVYEGNFGSLTTTSGLQTNLTAGGQVVGQFEVNGRSAAGFDVTIVGSFDGSLIDGVLTDRSIRGTWIEHGGTTGEVYGEAPSLVVSTASGGTAGGSTTPASALAGQ